MDQQHPELCFAGTLFPWPNCVGAFPAPPAGVLGFGYETATLFLISRVIRVKACSTFLLSLADVSKNLTQ